MTWTRVRGRGFIITRIREREARANHRRYAQARWDSHCAEMERLDAAAAQAAAEMPAVELPDWWPEWLRRLLTVP